MEKKEFQELDLTKPIGDKSFRLLLTKNNILSYKSSVRGEINLTEDQLKAFIAEIYTYGVCYSQVEQKQKRELFHSVVEDKMKLFKYVKEFSAHLLNNLDAYGKAELFALGKLKFDFQDPLKNERLFNFISEELLDVTFSCRQWEFGRHIMRRVSKDSFDQNSLNFVKEGFKNSDLSFKNQFKRVAERLDKSDELVDREKQLLCMIIKDEVQPTKTSIADFLIMGSMLQAHLLSISKRMKILNKEMSLLQQKKLYKGKGRGGQKL